MMTSIPAARLVVESDAAYTIHVTHQPSAVRAAQRLRFQVFNVELGEGLEQAFDNGLDEDRFDEVCDHLLVEHTPTGTIVGTYRLQTGVNAAAHLGYYGEQEFDFSGYEPMRGELVELGRACVAREHRNLVVLGLLWKGIADYASAHGARYLIGCSSLASRDEAAGASAYSSLCRKYLAGPGWLTRPRPAFECSLKELAEEAPEIPKLLRAYLSLGAKICGPPALDRGFGTIDFLTLLDLWTLPPQVRSRFFGDGVRQESPQQHIN
jgi:putative hemolysin